MDTVLNSNVNQKSKVLKVTLVIMALATVLPTVKGDGVVFVLYIHHCVEGVFGGLCEC